MDYSKLTNAELDKLIAERKGYHRIDYREHDGTISLGAVPRYSTDPHYVMELLKEIDILFLRVERMAYSWTCYDGVAISKQGVYGVAQTPERAIAEAWLQWSENGV